MTRKQFISKEGEYWLFLLISIIILIHLDLSKPEIKCKVFFQYVGVTMDY